MLYIARSLGQLEFSQLMTVYEEGNLENAEELYPELSKGQALLRAEQDFYQYLRESFFKTQGAYYAIWQENGCYVSALRMEPYRDGVLLEALETHPQYRRQGFAEKLIRVVLPMEKKIYSHVGKRNAASLAVHKKCGFQRISEQAAYIDGSVNDKCCTLCFEKGK